MTFSIYIGPVAPTIERVPTGSHPSASARIYWTGFNVASVRHQVRLDAEDSYYNIPEQYLTSSSYHFVRFLHPLERYRAVLWAITADGSVRSEETFIDFQTRTRKLCKMRMYLKLLTALCCIENTNSNIICINGFWLTDHKAGHYLK